MNSRDFEDLNNERAGNETGRIRRFLPERDPKHIATQKEDRERNLSALMQMMRDPAYAAAYQGAWDALDRAQAAVDAALLETAEAIHRLTDITDDMDARAHRLGDEAVFEGDDGACYRADGSRLTEDEAARVERREGAPSYDARRMAQDALDAARARRAEIIGIQETVIDPARERLTDPDNPMSPSELGDLTDTLNGVVDELSRTGPQADFEQAIQFEQATPSPPLSLDDIGPPRTSATVTP
jgi:hypothetical protein